MPDLHYVIQWWIPLFLIGIIFYPLSSLIFEKFEDRGYAFSKVLALGVISYTLFILNTAKLLPFNIVSAVLVIWIFIIINYVLKKRSKKLNKKNFPWKIIAFEEILFLAGIIFWSYIRGHEPSINGLEKFMDFGFLNSILRSNYIPPIDIWFPPYPINYYYFGHFITAILTKLSFLPSYITFNLMIATLFSFTFVLGFSLALNFLTGQRKKIIGGILTAALLAFAGNLHTIYTLFKIYNVDHPVPFWQLPFLPFSFPNNYWYPNATRFIPFTIHEFPIYSFVVSDLHGHVLDIPFVLLSIAFAYVLYLQKSVSKLLLALISLFLAIMYMTNVWDGAIYMLLAIIILFIKNWHYLKGRFSFHIQTLFLETLKYVLLILVLFFVFSLPFNFYFRPFAEGIGVLCAPSFLTNIGKIGPFLFEANHCQKSPWWQLLTLYGFFYFFVISFLIFLRRTKQTREDIFILVLIFLSTLLIIIPEVLYVKDIYPAHYRANTMFKLVYQAFMMLSFVSGYIIMRVLNTKRNFARFLFLIFTLLLLILVFVYPYFAIKSYYGDLKNYTGLDGIVYLKTRYPQDYVAINWMNTNISGRPVIVEAQGDSYTDYERVSANTGLPTILGWTVHEWLWRGTYDIPAPRIGEVKDIYENTDLNKTRKLLKKYNVEYVYVGGLEHQKYPNLIESKFEKLGKVVFQQGTTKLYKLNI